jgi:hypothetical protein
MLPILEEIRNDLYQRNRCHERRRRRLVGGVISVATVLAASATVLLSGLGRHSPALEQGRVVLTGHASGTSWRLVAYRVGHRECLTIIVGAGAVPRSRCDLASKTAPAKGLSAGRVNEGTLGFVYGVATVDVQRVAVRLDNGHCSTTRTARAAPNRSAASASASLRVYVIAYGHPVVPIVPAKPAHGRNPDKVIRVPKDARLFPGGSAAPGTCSDLAVSA